MRVHGKKEVLLLKDREGGGPAAPVPPAADSWKSGKSGVEQYREKKNPQVRPHRRISFRRDLEQESLKTDRVEDNSGR